MERSASSGEWAFEWDEDALIAQAAVRDGDGDGDDDDDDDDDDDGDDDDREN